MRWILLDLYEQCSDHITEYPIYGEDWLEKKGQTLAEIRASIPKLQTYRKGAGEKIPDWSLLEASVFGTDVSRQMVRISMMNLVLHGIDQPNLWHGNSLTRRATYAALFDQAPKTFDVILTNPPFGGKEGKDA